MTVQQVKDSVGVFLVLAHFVSLGAVLISYFAGGFDFSEMTTSVSIILPILAGYTAVVVRYFLDKPEKPSSRPGAKKKKAKGTFVFISFLLPGLFVLFVLTLILLWSFNRAFESFEQFKTLLAMTEVFFGAYLAQLVKSLFGEDGTSQERG